MSVIENLIIRKIFLQTDKIFSDAKKGEKVPYNIIENSFGTLDINVIAEKIVKEGEVMVDQEHRSAEQEQKVKRVVDFLSTNAIDPQSGNPITAKRIRSALEQAHVNIKNVPVENQIQKIIEKISEIIPIKIETKRVRVTIPAIQTGKAYGVISQYKESEIWLDNGDLEVITKVPAGMIMDFYDKLNGITHGSAVTEEIREE